MSEDTEGYGTAALAAEMDEYAPPLRACVDCGRMRYTRRDPPRCLDCILKRAQAADPTRGKLMPSRQ